MTDSPAVAASSYTLADLFRDSAQRFTDRTAVIGCGVTLTYAELDRRSDLLAAALAARGIGRGDRVLVNSTTRPEYIETYIAAAKIGAAVVGTNYRLSRDELADCVQRARPALVFTAPAFSETVRDISRAVDPTPDVVSFGVTAADADCDYARLLDGPGSEAYPEPCPEDVHAVIFTSGTTGRPKGAMISQRAAVTRAIRQAQWAGLTSDDGYVGWVPLFHTSIETVTATLLTGGRWMTFEQVDIEQMYAAISEHRLTWTSLLPGVIDRFVDHPARDRYDLTSLRGAVGYANMTPNTVAAFTDRFDAEFWDAYGQTETSSLLARAAIRPHTRPAEFRKYPTALMSIRLVDEQMADVADGEPGECVVRGPGLMSGYLDDPDATAEVFRGGWLHTGDVLRRHDDGGLTFVERTRYLIKSGGENVYPAEIEHAIGGHPAVAEVCVVGVPHEVWGECAVAFVVLGTGSSATADELLAWSSRALSRFKRPRRLHFLDAGEVPRSVTGKIIRHELEQLAKETDPPTEPEGCAIEGPAASAR